MRPTAEQLIARLDLAPLPHEGGFFRQTYRSPQTLDSGRPLGTAILFLLTPDSFSALHRLITDEVWHFLDGDPIEHLALDDAGAHGHLTTLGHGLLEGELPQLVVHGGLWQGARLRPGGAWALCSCTMAPGWDEREFELGHRARLTASHPRWAPLIQALTR